MLTIPTILLVLALIFLVVNALNKLPAWPWGLCIILRLLVGGLVMGFLWSAPVAYAADLSNKKGPLCWDDIGKKWADCPVKVSDPDVVPEGDLGDDSSDLSIELAAGYSLTVTGSRTGHSPAVDIAVGFDLAPDEKAPRFELLGSFDSLPGVSTGGEVESFRGFGVEGLLSQPIGALFLRPAVLVGFDTRVNGDATPLHRSARYAYLGVRFAKADRGSLFIGGGGDERLSTADRERPDYLPAGIISWRLRIGDITGDLDASLVGRAILYLRLGYGAATAGADAITLNFLAGWGKRQ